MFSVIDNLHNIKFSKKVFQGNCLTRYTQHNLYHTFSFFISSRLWFTVFNAFFKYINTHTDDLFLPIVFSIFSINSNKVMRVDVCFIKPY